jgi:plastocyanin
VETTLTMTPRGRQAPAALGKLTAAALGGVALVLAALQIFVFGFAPPIAGVAVAALVVAGLVAAGWRWTPALGGLLCLALLGLLGPMMLPMLAEPSIQGVMFGVSAVTLSLLAVGALAGIGATVQNYRAQGERRAPRWLAGALTLLAGVLAGAMLAAAAPQPGIHAGISPQALAALPALDSQNWEFSQKELRVKAGQQVALRLTNADPEAHYLDIDELDVHAPIAPGKTSVAVFTAPDAPGTYLFYCHPHADKATGEGMVGTLVVE